MDFKTYQQQADTTCMDSSRNLVYMFENLLGEVGELTEKVNGYVEMPDLCETAKDLMNYGSLAKLIRKHPESHITKTEISIFEPHVQEISRNEDLKKELGDILWQMAGMCTHLGWSLEDIAQQNLDKLARRKATNQIDGNGDNR